MKKHTKIAIYSGEIPSTTFIERLISGLAKKGKNIYVFGPKKFKTITSANVHEVSYKNNKRSKLFHFLKYNVLLFIFKRKQKSRLDAIIKEKHNNKLNIKVKFYPVLWHQPDIFHLQWAKGLSDWIWVKEFNIKLVLSLRGAHINYSPIANLKLANMYCDNFPKVDGFHAVSKAIAKEAQKYNASVNKIKVVYSGLNSAEFKSNKYTSNSTLNIISVGRPHWKKGYTYALDTCKILKNKGLEFRYTIIGGASDIELKYQIHDLGLNENVTLIGQLSQNKVKEKIQSSDVLLLPSVEEGIANVVLEAMILNTLVLTTDCGGMSEVITDEQNGFIVPIRNSEKMAEKILYISKLTEEQKSKIRHEAYQKISDQHNESKMIDGMLKLYNNL